MTQRNAGAVDVQSVIIVPTPALEHGQDLTRKGLVQFNQIHIIKTQASALEQFLNGWHRANAHVGRMTAGSGPAGQVGTGHEAQRFKLILGNDQAGGSGIILLGGIACGHDAPVNRL